MKQWSLDTSPFKTGHQGVVKLMAKKKQPKDMLLLCGRNMCLDSQLPDVYITLKILMTTCSILLGQKGQVNDNFCQNI